MKSASNWTNSKAESAADMTGLNADYFAGYDASGLKPGLQRLSHGDSAGAAAIFRKAAARSPRVAGIFLLLGQAYAKAERESDSVAAFERAAALHPDALAGFTCLLGLAGPMRHGTRSGSPDNAVRQALHRRISNDPRCWWAYALRGSCRFKERSGSPEILQKAEEDLRRARTLRPACGWIHALQAQLTWHHKTAEASASIARARRLLPESGWILAWKAQISAKTGRVRPALAEFNRALRLAPEYALAYAWRGALRLRLGQPRSAESDLIQALSLRPEHGLSWAALGEIRRRQGRIDESLEHLSRSILCEPEASRSFAWSRDPRAVAAAARTLEVFIDRRPKEAVARCWLGELYLRQKEHSLCLRQLSRFINAARGAGLNPLLGWAYRWRAEANAELGSVAASRTDYRAALRVNPALDYFPGC